MVSVSKVNPIINISHMMSHLLITLRCWRSVNPCMPSKNLDRFGRPWVLVSAVSRSLHPRLKITTKSAVRGSLHPPLEIPTKSAVRGSLHASLEILTKSVVRGFLLSPLKIWTDSAVRGSFDPLFKIWSDSAVRGSLHPPLKIIPNRRSVDPCIPL